jgi:hypothetical protein
MFKREAKMTSKKVAELKKEILKVTPVTVVPKAKPIAKAKVVRQSAKAKAVAEALKAFPGDWDAVQSSKGVALVKVFEALLGEKIVLTQATPVVSGSGAPRIDKGNLRQFQAIVPEVNPNGYSAVLGKPVLLLHDGGSHGLQADGTCSPSISRSNSRYATAKEIDQFLVELQAKAEVNKVAQLFN